MTERKYNGSSTNRATYLYGADGSLAQMVDFSVGTRTQFTYDLADRLVSQKEYATTAKNGGALRSSTDFTYADKTNYLTGIKHFSPLGTQTIGYTYGNIGLGQMPDQIYKVSWNGQEKLNYTYDTLGRLTNKQILVGGDEGIAPLTTEYAYVNVGEGRTTTLVQSVQTAAGTYSYTYDSVGNIKSISFGTKYTNTYDYDDLNQLVRENNQQIGKTYTYAYQNGNITERKEYAYTTGELGEVLDTKIWTYGNSTWSDLLTDFNGIQITYDEIGNPTAIGEVTLSWNGRQLKQAVDGGNTYNYAYNIDGQRVSKTVTESNGTVTTTEYFYNGEILAGQKTGDNTLVFMYDNDGTAFGFTYNGTEYYYLKNMQGDVDAVVDSNRQIVAKYAYDAWGKVVSVTDADGVEITDYTHIGHINPIRYRGYYYDRETDFYYLNSRYYAPDICRFLNADSIVDNRSFNTQNSFQYCGNNPVNNSDPNGHLFGAILAIGLLTVGMLFLSGCGNSRSSAPAPSTVAPSTTSPATSAPTSQLTDEQKKFVAVVAGEAIGANSRTRKAVAHTIVNRVKEPRDVWRRATCINDVLIKSQYNAIGDVQYNKAMSYLNNRDGSNSTYEGLIADVMPIYYGEESDFTGGAHYIFNANTEAGKALEASLNKQPNRYVKCGPFDGVSDTEYRMYRCLGG